MLPADIDIVLYILVSEGVYSLEVLSPQYVFSQCKIKVEGGGQITVVEYKFPGGES